MFACMENLNRIFYIIVKGLKKNMTQNYELANSPKIQNKKQWKSK